MKLWQPIPAGALLRGRYEVQALLGRGGFGATYHALDRERFGAPCALKELLPGQAENPKVLELFEREARMLLALRHPGIPALHAYFTEGDRYYLVQDFVPGATLAEELARRGMFSEADVIQVLRETLAILDYLHSRRPAVIHRDVKPANVMRHERGQLYLLDFGAVKEALGRTTLSPESTIIGSSGYTPPEQLRGLVCPASDLYALGATAVHLLTGRPPGDWYDVIEGCWRFQGRLAISAGLEQVLAGLLEQQVSKRFQSAAEVEPLLRVPTHEAMPANAAAAVAPGTPYRPDIGVPSTRGEIGSGETPPVQTFENVWYRPSEKTWSERRAFTDTGTLVVRASSLEFHGEKQRVVIAHVRGVSLVRQGADFVNRWVRVEYGDRGGLRTAFFADGSAAGWGGLFGGTRRILAALQHLVT